jgi:hypothetical protein
MLLLLAAAGSRELSLVRAASDDPTLIAGKAVQGRNPEGKPRPKFTLGKDTTYVTGPLDAGGRIDYVYALNERLSRGVTPASNANVLLWKAIGPRPEGAAMPPDFFQWLGYEPPEGGHYYVDLFRYARDHLGLNNNDIDALMEQMDRTGEGPWTAKQYPILAQWLKANEKPLRVVAEAVRRPHYFNPLVPARRGEKGESLIGSLVPQVQRCREFAFVLPARAMLHVGEGRHAEGWQDLLTCHRLGRQLARGGTLIEVLVGLAIENVAAGADVAYLGRARLSAKQIKDCLRDLERLPPRPSMADQMDICERFTFLDVVMMLDRDGVQSGLQSLDQFGFLPLQVGRDPRTLRVLSYLDWDSLLRAGNRWYDRLAASLRVKERGLRERQLDELESELKKRKEKLVAAGGFGKALLAARSPAERGERIADGLLALLVPAMRKVCQAADRTEQIGQNLRVAFALAAHKSEHGRYPKDLKALAPGYLARVPPDLFSGKALIYRPRADGYLLYSVGVNGQDEDGRFYDDDPPGDDLAVRMPLPKPK